MNTSPYNQATIRHIRNLAKRNTSATKVCHIFPRAYCIAKPAPGCAVFATPWMDAEPQIRTTAYSSYRVVHSNVEDVKVGDWCSIAYLTKGFSNGMHVIEILK
jgi:hypothetical protein